MLKEVTIEITGKCYNNCIYCSSCSDKYNFKLIHVSDVINIIEELKTLGVTKVNLSGGEPLLHPDIISILRSFKDTNIDVAIYSSGIYDNIQPIPYTLLRYVKLYTSKIIFNVQAVDNDLYRTITNSNHNIDIVLKSIERAIQFKIPTEVNFVPMKINLNQIELLLSLCESIGVSKVNFLRLVNQGRAKDNEDILYLSENDIDILKNKLSDISKNKKYNIRIGNPLLSSGCDCEVIKNQKLVIKYDGKVIPCEAFKDYFSNKECDSIHDKSLSDIYNNSTIFFSLRNKCIKALSNSNEVCPAQILLKE